MQKFLILLFTLCFLTAPVLAAEKLVSYDFKDADLVYVLKTLAKDMGRQVYIGPNVKGKVTLKIEKMTAEKALAKVLALQSTKLDYKLVGTNTLVVAAPEKLAQVESQLLSPPAAPPPPREARYMTRSSIAAGVDPLSMSVNRPHPRPAVGLKGDFNTESYDKITETGFREVSKEPLSTFSVDVDTASYSNVRRFLQDGKLPPKDAVRVEEMINYFSYDFPRPTDDKPFSVSTELADCPWQSEHQLLQVALAAPAIDSADAPPRNLVFLLDVSGSMLSADKLPLIKSGFKLLVNSLRPEDHVAIVVYAGASGQVLAPTSGENKRAILDSLEGLEAGGSTNGGAGIELAYSLASENFQKGAINRVILATDGDFNVGTASRGELERLIEEKRETGIFLTVLGFGTGNLKDSQMEALADKGNGNYAYIDSLLEAQKVLVQEAGATLVTVAKDVKLQIEFNPLKVASYRLIGYENRRLANEDFDDDKKDAGEMGAGHTVTALYEIVPGKSAPANLRYQTDRAPSGAAKSEELALVKVRYKEPQGEKSQLSEYVVNSVPGSFAKSSENLRFAASVASVGLVLSGSEHKGTSNFSDALSWAKNSLGEDEYGYRREFLKLVELARGLQS